MSNWYGGYPFISRYFFFFANLIWNWKKQEKCAFNFGQAGRRTAGQQRWLSERNRWRPQPDIQRKTNFFIYFLHQIDVLYNNIDFFYIFHNFADGESSILERHNLWLQESDSNHVKKKELSFATFWFCYQVWKFSPHPTPIILLLVDYF